MRGFRLAVLQHAAEVQALTRAEQAGLKVFVGERPPVRMARASVPASVAEAQALPGRVVDRLACAEVLEVAGRGCAARAEERLVLGEVPARDRGRPAAEVQRVADKRSTERLPRGRLDVSLPRCFSSGCLAVYLYTPIYQDDDTVT